MSFAHSPGVLEKNVHGSGDIKVSSKGVVNGLSDIPNDGSHFGPDTTLGGISPNQIGAPYTQTQGQQEAANYAHSLGGGKVELINEGVPYNVYTIITVYQDTTIEGNYSILNYYTSVNNPIFSIGAVSNPNHIIKNLTINVKQAPSGGLGNVVTGTTMNKLPEYENVTINANGLAQIGFNFSNGSNSGCINCYVTQVTQYAYYASAGTGMFFDNCNYVGTSQGDGSYTYYWGGGDTLRINGGRSEGGSGLIWIDSTNNTCTQARISRAESDAATQSIMFQIGNNPITQIVFENLLITDPSNKSISAQINTGATGYLSEITINGGIYTGAGNGFLNLYALSMNGGTFTVNNAIIANNNTVGNTEQGEFNNPAVTGNIAVNNCIIVPSATDVLARAPLSPYSITFNNCTLTGTWSNPVEGNVIMHNCINPPQTPPSISTNPLVSATVYQNTNPYDIRLKIPVTYNPTATAAATLATGISQTSTVTTSTKVSIPAGLTAADGEILTYDIVVPAGWYFELIATNAVIGTAEVQAA